MKDRPEKVSDDQRPYKCSNNIGFTASGPKSIEILGFTTSGPKSIKLSQQKTLTEGGSEPLKASLIASLKASLTASLKASWTVSWHTSLKVWNSKQQIKVYSLRFRLFPVASAAS